MGQAWERKVGGGDYGGGRWWYGDGGGSDNDGDTQHLPYIFSNRNNIIVKTLTVIVIITVVTKTLTVLSHQIKRVVTAVDERLRNMTADLRPPEEGKTRQDHDGTLRDRKR